MRSLPFSAMDALEATVISFILSGMWWTGLDRIIGLETVPIVLGVVGSTAILGASLLYLDYRPRRTGRMA